MAWRGATSVSWEQQVNFGWISYMEYSAIIKCSFEIEHYSSQGLGCKWDIPSSSSRGEHNWWSALKNSNSQTSTTITTTIGDNLKNFNHQMSTTTRGVSAVQGIRASGSKSIHRSSWGWVGRLCTNPWDWTGLPLWQQPSAENSWKWSRSQLHRALRPLQQLPQDDGRLQAALQRAGL